MKDLTQGSIIGNLVTMAAPIAAGMGFQTLYVLVDLYFIAGLGDAAIAGVSAAGTMVFAVMALTQALGVGSVALISRAVGRKDRHDANVVFNQALVFATLAAAATLAIGYAATGAYVSAITPDAATRAAGTTYLYSFLPGMALQFGVVTMASALRGTGIVKPPMVIQSLTVLLNTMLAPMLITGWGTGRPFGVAGAGLASTIAVAVGVIMLTTYFVKLEKYIEFRRTLWRPQFATWRRFLAIGLPVGGEFMLTFLYTGVIYYLISDLGATVQAGFGIGWRIVQAIFLPMTAIAFAAAPIAGQNFGAGHLARVRETFAKAILLNCAVMLPMALLLRWRPEVLVAFFTADTDVRVAGAGFLQMIALALLAHGVTFTCSGLFQGLGNTAPALASSALRLTVFLPLAFWFAAQADFRVEHIWHLSVTTVWLQAMVSYLLLQGQFRRQTTALAELGAPLWQSAFRVKTGRPPP